MSRRTPALLVLFFALALAGAALAGVTAHRSTARTRIVVTEREFRITFAPAKAPAGPATLVVKNVGKFPHALSLSGPSKAHTATIAPGKSATLNVTLKAGTYSAWCPISNHAARGMKARLVATGAAGGGGGGGYGGGTTTGTTMTDTTGGGTDWG
jgi:hypothetical protein